MIHELRTYHCMPGRLPDVLARFETVTLRLFERHGIRQIGFWTYAVGGPSHDLVYLIEWESMADREARWGAFQTDPEWVQARLRSEADGPIIASGTNALLTPTSFSATGSRR